MGMPEVSLKYLTDAVRYEDRTADISPYAEVLHAEGYDMNLFVRELISEFGVPELLQPAFRVKKESGKLHIKPSKISERNPWSRIKCCEKRTDKPIVVTGEAPNGHFFLMMSDTGRVYV